jgi:hypothetical protein
MAVVAVVAGAVVAGEAGATDAVGVADFAAVGVILLDAHPDRANTRSAAQQTDFVPWGTAFLTTGFSSES